MTLRKSGGGDAQRIHEQVDELLDGEDGVLVLFDGRRVVTYAEGFGLSASQLELLSVEVERALRRVVGRQPAQRATRKTAVTGAQRPRAGDRVDGTGTASVVHILRKG